MTDMNSTHDMVLPRDLRPGDKVERWYGSGHRQGVTYVPVREVRKVRDAYRGTRYLVILDVPDEFRNDIAGSFQVGSRDRLGVQRP